LCSFAIDWQDGAQKIQANAFGVLRAISVYVILIEVLTNNRENMVSVAVILAGCGHFDGSEIRESVLTLLALDEQGADVSIFAPDVEQKNVINHRTGDIADDSRNVLAEAGRIARGVISPLTMLDFTKFDALIVPGGFGVAKNLSDLATHGEFCAVDPLLKRIIQEFIAAKKPIGACCIAPAIVVAAMREHAALTVTIGDDPDGLIPKLGGKHVVAQADEVVVDVEHRLVSTSAYMRDDALAKIAVGIRKTVKTMLDLCTTTSSI
jgi:enhancing lycopene biosynthesis protein 2